MNSEVRPCILTVDDDHSVLQALRAALESNDYQVRAAASGELAIRSVMEDRPDVVLLDLSLPDLDGVDVCARLRRWSLVPIIVVSVHDQETDRVRALDAGADDYVTKPFSMPELLARIRAALRREQARRKEEPLIEHLGLSVDLAARRVLVDGSEVHLTPTEYQLLRVLATNPDRVLTHTYLLRTALGPEYEYALDNLRTFVRQLRRKIEREPSRPRWIMTEPGVGYRFRTELM
ncbi:MAG: response regulator transcription factor [Chloroflexi bacterium]|nr:response regulator transcription factor [Chloroflexota bacterium]